MKPFGVKISKAIKKGRKIIIEFESDIYSDEVFAVTPFYDEGDENNQLQYINFGVKIKEQSGKVDAEIHFGNAGSHFTKGHSQIHNSLTQFYKSKKDCARNWVDTAKEEYFDNERKQQILKLWENDNKFYSELVDRISAREQKLKDKKFKEAENELIKAATNYYDMKKANAQ